MSISIYRHNLHILDSWMSWNEHITNKIGSYHPKIKNTSNFAAEMNDSLEQDN